jgi:RsiW-degrading membrane proteinase PrsW (M82 family)
VLFLIHPIIEAISQFLLGHPVLIYLVGSGICLLSARQDWARPRYEFGTYFWQSMAIFVLLAFCGQAMLHGMWVSLSIAIVAIVAEIWWMKAWARQRNREKA